MCVCVCECVCVCVCVCVCMLRACVWFTTRAVVKANSQKCFSHPLISIIILTILVSVLVV